jgi:hypothetical protein
MPIQNKLRTKKPAKVTLELVQTPESVIPQQPAPKRRGRPKKVQPIEPSAPITAEPPSEFPVPAPKKARKPRAKKDNTELMEQLPVKAKKQKLQVEVEIDPIITTKPARKPRITKAQKNKQIFEEEVSASEEQSEAEEDEEEEDSDQELDRCIERLAKIKQLQE